MSKLQLKFGQQLVYLILIVILGNIFTIGYAKANQVSLILNSIQYNRSAEDRVFIYITEYSSLGEPKEFRIPSYPKHWLTPELSRLKNMILWQDKLKALEEKTIIISLVDHDYPPLDSNEPLGSVRLTIINTATSTADLENIKFNWEDADFDEPIKIKKIVDLDNPEQISFKLTNERNEYILNFSTKISN